MFPNVYCRFCSLSRLLNKNYKRLQSVLADTDLSDSHESVNLEHNSLTDKKQSEIMSHSSKHSTDPAVLLMGSPLTMDTGQSRSSHCRSSIPFTQSLLDSSFNITQSPKRKFTQCSSSVVEKPEPEVIQLEAGYGEMRQWELTSLGREQLHRPRGGFEFFVMSYNILAQNLLRDNAWLYQGSPDYVLEWDYRSEKILNEILGLNQPEIVCLQEVNVRHYHEYFEPRLRRNGYEGVYVKRTGDKQDGCATFYKSDKFTLEDTIPVEYYKSNCSLLDRDNVGLIVKLRPNKHPCSDEESICVANTHLLFNPRRGDIKLAQVIWLLAELDKASKISNNHHCQVLVCGDFNATPFSDVYKFMTHGYLRYEGLIARLISGQREGQSRGNNKCLSRNFFPSHHKISDQCRHINKDERPVRDIPDPSHRNPPALTQSSGYLWHHFNLVSTYRHTIERLGHYESEVTTQHSADSCTVDYIFYGVLDKNDHSRRNKHSSTNVMEGKLKLLGRWGLMSRREIRELGNLPNHYNPSDHLPLLVRMILL